MAEILQAQEPIAVANFVIDIAKKIICLSQICNFRKYYFFLQGFTLCKYKYGIVNGTFSKWQYGPVQKMFIVLLEIMVQDRLQINM